MANKLKGEIEIVLGGKKLTLRPTFEGLLEIEDKAGAGLGEVVGKFARREWSFKQVAAVIYGGLFYLKAEPWSFEAVGNAIMSDGIKSFLTPAALLVSHAVAPEKDAEPEVESEKKDEAPVQG